MPVSSGPLKSTMAARKKYKKICEQSEKAY